MKYLICYDITEDAIRGKMVRYLEAFTYRLQYSVFNCNLNSKNAAEVWDAVNIRHLILLTRF